MSKQNKEEEKESWIANFLFQEPQKISSLKSFKIQTQYRAFSLLQRSKMAFLSNTRWKPRKERPNRSTNNGCIDDITKRPVSEGVTSK